MSLLTYHEITTSKAVVKVMVVRVDGNKVLCMHQLPFGWKAYLWSSGGKQNRECRDNAITKQCAATGL